MTVSFH